MVDVIPTNLRALFEDWCREFGLELTLARQEAFEDGYNARVRFDDQRDAEIEKLKAQVIALQSSLDAGPPIPGKKTPDALPLKENP